MIHEPSGDLKIQRNKHLVGLEYGGIWRLLHPTRHSSAQPNPAQISIRDGCEAGPWDLRRADVAAVVAPHRSLCDVRLQDLIGSTTSDDRRQKKSSAEPAGY